MADTHNERDWLYFRSLLQKYDKRSTESAGGGFSGVYDLIQDAWRRVKCIVF